MLLRRLFHSSRHLRHGLQTLTTTTTATAASSSPLSAPLLFRRLPTALTSRLLSPRLLSTAGRDDDTNKPWAFTTESGDPDPFANEDTDAAATTGEVPLGSSAIGVEAEAGVAGADALEAPVPGSREGSGAEPVQELDVRKKHIYPERSLSLSRMKFCDSMNLFEVLLINLARVAFNDTPTTIFWTDYVATRWYRAPELCGSFFSKENNPRCLRPGKVSPRLSVPNHIQRPPYVNSHQRPGMNSGPEIQDEKGIECMRASGKLAAQVLKFAGTLVKA